MRYSGVRISPKKLAKVAALVRGLSVDEAFAQLAAVSPLKGAAVTQQCLRSAQANGVNTFGLQPQRLRVASVTVTKGPFLRRIKFHARGRSGVMHHPKAHMRVTVEEVQPDAPLTRRAASRGGDAGAALAAAATAGGVPAAPAGDIAAAPARPPAWMRHRQRRAQRAARVAASVAASRGGGSPQRAPGGGAKAAATKKE